MSRIGQSLWRGSVWTKSLARDLPLLRNRARKGAARVYYGYRRLPAADEKAAGGIIKCQDLEKAFPNTIAGFNVLYLVSSALPPHAPRMAAIAKRTGARLVLNQNGVAYPAWHGPDWERTNEPMRKLLQAADYVFYQSAFCKLGADRFLGERNGPSEILLNPVDTSVFVPADGDPAPDRLVLLVSGSHWQFYRVQTAVECLALVLRQVPTARLIVAGKLQWRRTEVEAQKDIADLCRELKVGGAVQVWGPYSQSGAVPMFQSSHILLHTKYNDPCPRLVVEAMACGLPVVYSASGGVPELVGEEAGIGLPAPLDWEQLHPPDPRAMAEAVLRIAERRAAFSAAARRRAVEQLDVARWTERHRQVFGGLLA